MPDIYGDLIYGILFTPEEDAEECVPDIYKRYTIGGYESTTVNQVNGEGEYPVIVGFKLHDYDTQHKPVVFPTEDVKADMRGCLEVLLGDRFKEPDYYLAVGISY